MQIPWLYQRSNFQEGEIANLAIYLIKCEFINYLNKTSCPVGVYSKEFNPIKKSFQILLKFSIV